MTRLGAADDLPSMPVTPASSFDEKARRLRLLYREMVRRVDRGEAAGRDIFTAVDEEYERLFGEPSKGLELAGILKSVWTEARELAGWTYDRRAQAYYRSDGSRMLYDDGSEWRHL